MTKFTQQFLQDTGAKIPIICGPMYPGSNPELVAAVSEAGGFGIVQPISLTHLYGYDFREGLRLIKKLTDKPFGVNFTIFGGGNKKYYQQMQTWMEISIEEDIKFFLTSLGKPHAVVKRAKEHGIKVYHDIPNKKVALQMKDAGVDGLNCVNWRGGGQTGIQSAEKFMEELHDIDLPLICAGGISNTNDFRHALQMGYAGVQMGTRFLATKECQVTNSYKQAIVDSTEEDIIWTNKISGNNSSVIKTPEVMKGGHRIGSVLSYFLKKQFSKKYVRMYLMYWGIQQYKKATFNEAYKFWQAGKGIGNIKTVEPAGDIVRDFQQAFEAFMEKVNP